MGSKSDMPEMEKAGEILTEKGIHFEVRVMSAHRDPDTVADYCRNARMRGLRVIIAGAGLSAALPGVAAAHSDLPVIGVPLSSRLSAWAASTRSSRSCRCRPGVPVACVGLDNARNAGHPGGADPWQRGDRALHPPRSSGAIWTDEARMEAWRRVEVAACEEMDGPTADGPRGDPRGDASPSRRCRSASASPTTTWRPSSTCCSRAPGRAGAGSTSG